MQAKYIACRFGTTRMHADRNVRGEACRQDECGIGAILEIGFTLPVGAPG
jgi:hypothetical protein